jgi:hypothetical protein
MQFVKFVVAGWEPPGLRKILLAALVDFDPFGKRTHKSIKMYRLRNEVLS